MDALVERLLREAAVGAGDDVFRPTSLASRTIRSSHQLGISDTTLVAWLMTPGISTEPFGSLTSCQMQPFVLVAWVRHLQHIGAGAHAQDQIHNVARPARRWCIIVVIRQNLRFGIEREAYLFSSPLY